MIGLIHEMEIREEGREEGRKEGVIDTLSALVRKNRLTIKEAAREAGISEDEFRKKMNEEQSSRQDKKRREL